MVMCHVDMPSESSLGAAEGQDSLTDQQRAQGLNPENFSRKKMEMVQKTPGKAAISESATCGDTPATKDVWDTNKIPIFLQGL